MKNRANSQESEITWKEFIKLGLNNGFVSADIPVPKNDTIYKATKSKVKIIEFTGIGGIDKFEKNHFLWIPSLDIEGKGSDLISAKNNVSEMIKSGTGSDFVSLLSNSNEKLADEEMKRRGFKLKKGLIYFFVNHRAYSSPGFISLDKLHRRLQGALDWSLCEVTIDIKN